MLLDRYLTMEEIQEKARDQVEVGQAGVKSGFGCDERPFLEGKVNPIESIKRVRGNYFWELLVVGKGSSHRFSRKGDSGSAVFTKEGEVIGLLNGGWDPTGPQGEKFDNLREIKVYSEEDKDPNPKEKASLKPYAGDDVSYVSPIE
jgi:hypothetical protein